MHLLSVLKVVGALMMVLGGAQLVPMAASLLYGEGDWPVFLASALAVLAAGGFLFTISRNASEISVRDGFAVVTFSWIAAAIAGSLPYYFSGAVATFTDAMFESMSGFTTTGASVLTDFAVLSHGILLWRSMTQWFGGMGIIVLALVILPALGIGGMQLYRRESPGPDSDKITPRIRDTAKALWAIYLLLTVSEALALYILGMTPFEAVNHSLTTVATGGFSTRADSIGGFDSAAIEWTLIGFMLFGGMNFTLHYRLFTKPGQRWGYFGNLEWWWFVSAVAIASLSVIAYLFFKQDYALSEALTKGVFQVVSLATSSGFVSDDYVRWGAFPQILLVIMMLGGGCAGSTSGGIKWLRILLMFKNIRLQLLRLVHPHVVVQVKINHAVVTRDIQRNIYAFVSLFFITLGVLTLLISLDGHSMLTSIGAAVSALANIGPGLDAVGPTESYLPLSAYVKWLLISGMLLGRLELMTVFMLLLPFTWRP
ncbi:MAG: TrkH family potassium uptake protein [SAR324 cluster bacterium]|nr:TrkH family potassium uptake protein [SAR324 cluster bacterium]